MTVEQLEEFVEHQLTFRFRGLAKQKTWTVCRRTAQVIGDVLQKEKRHSAFFVFEDKAGMTVCVNLEYIQYCHSLWDALGEVPERERGVRVQLLGADDLLILEASDEPDEFYLGELLSYSTPGQKEFVTWLDVDGEQAFLNPREVVYVEFPSEYESPIEEVPPIQMPPPKKPRKRKPKH